jgi:formylglycine-generating enzyme required for sulfatase activity
MVILAAGDFQMGINEAIAIKEGLRIYPYEMELPVHKVSVKSFAIAKYDVTNREFAVFAKETGFDPSGCKKYNGHGWVFDAVPQSRST